MSTQLVKYPRTLHLPYSEGVGSDDKVLKDVSGFHGKRVIVTEKMDGENTTMYRSQIHARSLDSKYHPSRNWVKNFWAEIAHKIPDGYRVCGENLYAKHSIYYNQLPSYFIAFSIWEGDNCLSWDDTLMFFEDIGVIPAPVLYDGIFDAHLIQNIWNSSSDNKEGYVVRLADSFKYEQFSKSCAKFVRKNHVQTDEHWMYSSNLSKNLLQD